MFKKKLSEKKKEILEIIRSSSVEKRNNVIEVDFEDSEEDYIVSSSPFNKEDFIKGYDPDSIEQLTISRKK